MHVRQRQFHDLQRLLQCSVVRRGLRLVVAEDADQIDVITRRFGCQRRNGTAAITGQQALDQGHAQFITRRRACDRRAAGGTHAFS
ncbi:hypothetical protein D3C81_2215780 [compost metagenome]